MKNDGNVLDDEAEKDEPLDEEARWGNSDAASDVSNTSVVPEVLDKLEENQDDKAREVSAAMRTL